MTNQYELELLHRLRMAEAQRRGARAALLGEAGGVPRSPFRERAARALIAIAAYLHPPEEQRRRARRLPAASGEVAG